MISASSLTWSKRRPNVFLKTNESLQFSVPQNTCSASRHSVPLHFTILKGVTLNKTHLEKKCLLQVKRLVCLLQTHPRKPMPGLQRRGKNISDANLHRTPSVLNWREFKNLANLKAPLSLHGRNKHFVAHSKGNQNSSEALRGNL